MILRSRAHLPALEPAQSFDHQIRADRRQLRSQRLGGIFRANRNFALHEDVAGVEPGIDLHGREPGVRFAIENGPVDGRRAAILGQQRAMHVDPAEPRKINHPLRNDAAIADDDDRVRANRRKLVAEFGVVLDGGGLQQRQRPRRMAASCTGRNGHFHPAPARPIRLRHHQRHGMSSGEPTIQGSGQQNLENHRKRD